MEASLEIESLLNGMDGGYIEAGPKRPDHQRPG